MFIAEELSRQERFARSKQSMIMPKKHTLPEKAEGILNCG
jgi:hypothetical protein